MATPPDSPAVPLEVDGGDVGGDAVIEAALEGAVAVAEPAAFDWTSLLASPERDGIEQEDVAMLPDLGSVDPSASSDVGPQRRVGRPRLSVRQLAGLVGAGAGLAEHVPAGGPDPAGAAAGADPPDRAEHVDDALVPFDADGAILPRGDANAEYDVLVGTVAGFPLLGALGGAMTRFVQEKAAAPDVDVVMHDWLQPRVHSTALATMRLQKEDAEMHLATLTTALQRWAMAFWMCVLSVRACVEEFICTHLFSTVLQYVEFQRFDETPLPVTLLEDFDCELQSTSPQGALEDAV